MSEIQTGGGRGRTKNLEVNLVLFIDLMSVLITFLLITAVWTQVSMIQIGSSLYGKRNENQEQKPPPPQADIAPKVEITAVGYTVTVARDIVSLPLLNGDYDDVGLIAQLEKAKQLYPERTDAAIAMQDDLPYERLIRGMDGLLKAGFPAISVLTGGPR